MSTQTISTEKILRLTEGCVAISSLSAVGFLFSEDAGWGRGPAGGIGIMAAFSGSGIATWFAFRARDSRFSLAAIVSTVPLAFWLWMLVKAIS